MQARLAWLRLALSGLTTRGRAFMAAGVAAAVCAIVLGQRDLLRVGVLLVVLPLGCALALGRSRYRIALSRSLEPQRVVAGGTSRVRLELENLTATPTRVLLAQEEVPHQLGASPRFVLARLPGRRRAAVTYSLRTVSRGRYDIGPLHLQLTDPFGMCELTRAFTATDPLVVVPRTWPLAPARGGGRWSGSGESLARTAAASGEDDVATREYRYGDDLRRVHWRSTARRGELMVRRDEQPRQMRATVLLDTRPTAHRGEGMASSFEWAVGAVASVAVHLADQRYGVRLAMDANPSGWTSGVSADVAGLLLDRLAVVEPGDPEDLAGAVSQLGRAGGDGLVVAVVGELEEHDATLLARSAGHRDNRAIAIVLRTTAWATLGPRRAEDLDAARRRAVSTLRAAGWVVAEAGPDSAVTQVWDGVRDVSVSTGPIAPGAYVAAPRPTAMAAGPSEEERAAG